MFLGICSLARKRLASVEEWTTSFETFSRWKVACPPWLPCGRMDARSDRWGIGMVWLGLFWPPNNTLVLLFFRWIIEVERAVPFPETNV